MIGPPASCDITRVDSIEDFTAALERGRLDLILSDNLLPGFSGGTALKIAREKRPAIPFIFISGTLGEERAIDSLKSGATDYVWKNRLSRLAPAMQEVDDRNAPAPLCAQTFDREENPDFMSHHLDSHGEAFFDKWSSAMTDFNQLKTKPSLNE
ncbi:MAG TPA: response regulator [Verrucomicrobiae bacterium]|jgi:DNA-binding NtrC family response regulator